MDPAPPLWRIALQVPEPALDAVTAALDRYCRSVSWFGADGGGWSVEALADREPDRPSLDVAVAVAAASAGMEPPHVHIARLPATDWLAANRQDFPPIRIGRFFVYGSHIAEPAPAGSIGLRVDAATAFGSGHHGTTAGCLMAIDDLGRRQGPSRVNRALGGGGGSLQRSL
ncbi:MAG: 50S ribosomal protein L11 methyltransferase [Rhodospirillales bacterium]|nr:50S ribosomal protein L11 methyltransferase [Rhodospirillales bacterium]